jgi:hypothetical protein
MSRARLRASARRSIVPGMVWLWKHLGQDVHRPAFAKVTSLARAIAGRMVLERTSKTPKAHDSETARYAAMCHEQLWKLKEDSVPGIRVDDQLRARNLLRERVRIDRRDHHVMMSIHGQGRLRNVCEF